MCLPFLLFITKVATESCTGTGKLLCTRNCDMVPCIIDAISTECRGNSARNTHYSYCQHMSWEPGSRQFSVQEGTQNYLAKLLVTSKVVACRGICDCSQEFWSAKIVFNHLIVPFQRTCLLHLQGSKDKLLGKLPYKIFVAPSLSWLINS